MKSTRGVKHDLNSLSQATRQVRKPLAETENTEQTRLGRDHYKFSFKWEKLEVTVQIWSVSSL